MIEMFNRNQIIGTIIFVISSSIGLFWEKNFQYANLIDTLLGLFSAIGIGLIFKFLPFKKNTI